MKDKTGLSICDGDVVIVQTSPDAPTSEAAVIDADSDRARELKSVLVQWDNGTSQYMPPAMLTVKR